MKTYIILSLLSTLTLYSETVQEVIEFSIQNNYQLQILEEERGIVSEQSDIEGLWSDPKLKIGINDIQAVRPLSRNVEAMQNQYVSYSQTIPLSKKLEVASALEDEKLTVLEAKAESLKVRIAYGIRKAFIDVHNAQKRLSILDDYIAFLHTPMNLLINLSAVEKNAVDKYIKTELLQKKYQLQRENALQRIQIAKEQVELIGNFQIERFSDEVEHRSYAEQSVESLLQQIEEKNPILGTAVALQEVASKGVDLAQEKEQADITVTGGYYQRFDRNDYLSFSVTYPLYTRGKQEKQKVQAMKRANIQNIKYNQTKIELEQNLKIALHQLKALALELEILKESHVKISKLIENAKLELSVGGSLVRYYELFTRQTNNALAQNRKKLSIANIENQITELLGERE